MKFSKPALTSNEQVQQFHDHGHARIIFLGSQDDSRGIRRIRRLARDAVCASRACINSLTSPHPLNRGGATLFVDACTEARKLEVVIGQVLKEVGNVS